MKRNLLTLLFCVWGVLSSHGQEKSIKFKTVSLYEEQTFYLNGGLRASVGGKSRVTYKIELPANTVEWYYSITVEKEEANNSIEAVNMFAQLTRLIDKTGVTSIVASSLLTPTGSGTCDAYLISENNISAFLAKRQFHYDFEDSVFNYKNGAMKVIMKPGYLNDFYIGFRNPSSMEGVTVHFSAVAIVAERLSDIGTIAIPAPEIEDPKRWTKQEKNRIYNNIEKGVKRFYAKNKIENCAEPEVKSIAACFTDAFIRNSKDTFLEMAEYEQERLLEDIVSNCPKCADLPSDIFAKATKM